ncbi:hypothetical protein [Mucilaginibacter agri]|uniref:Fimbrillin-A associated anchor protein Mfa1 and Mfa2 n=1 Tax=Mucilaginibacter agri TaxID=2695265 RepID=A0A965ZDY2_9SPHI|nr:hypothetical protein [Mucilaginibacter agri]NCD67997.1 hypothetical protein [Mucilaginibacter agri]
MNRYHFVFLIVCMISSSCKKDNSSHKSPDSQAPTPANAAFVPISFTVPQFSTTTKPLGSVKTTNALRDQIKYLYYVVYKGNISDKNYGLTPFRQIVQQAADADFGTITDSLPPGHYGIYFVGSQAAGRIYGAHITYTDETNKYNPVFTFDSNTFSENTFYKKLDTTINAKVNQSVSLTRIVGKVIIHITDTIPSNAAKFRLNFENFPPGLDLTYGEGLYDDNGHPTASLLYDIPAASLGKRDVEVSAAAWRYSYTEISLDCLDKNDHVIVHNIMPRAQFDRYISIDSNKQYVFTGELFAKSTPFTVTINDQWNAPLYGSYSLIPSSKR